MERLPLTPRVALLPADRQRLLGIGDPAAAYRKYVREGLNQGEDANVQQLHDWVAGFSQILPRDVVFQKMDSSGFETLDS